LDRRNNLESRPLSKKKRKRKKKKKEKKKRERERERSAGSKSGEYGGWDNTGNPHSAKNLATTPE
jgi:hypothetical protein